MYLNHSETSFYHYVLNGLHGEENDLDHQHSPDIMFTSFTKKSGRSAG